MVRSGSRSRTAWNARARRRFQSSGSSATASFISSYATWSFGRDFRRSESCRQRSTKRSCSFGSVHSGFSPSLKWWERRM